MFKILIVDDDKNLRYLLRETLELEHYTVLEAKDGVDALAVYEREHFDLVIVDIMMPRMNGYQFCEALRLTNPKLPILMISAKQLPADRKRGFLAGIDDFMTKPLDPEELILHIKSLLRRADIASEMKLTIGDVTLDYNAFTVTRGDEAQELPQKEFMLLYKLLSFPDKIFTRIQLMDEIWGPECDTGWETVTVHIGRLRRRFDGWEEFEIVNVRGIGYKAVRRI